MSIKINSMPVVLLGLVVIGLLAAFGASMFMAAPVAVPASYGAGDSGKTISMGEGQTFTIALEENPTTGYSWNETVTSGLQVLDSKYVQGGKGGLAGAGGTHVWALRAAGSGEQQFSAIYKRPWEPVTGNETSYKLTISVN